MEIKGQVLPHKFHCFHRTIDALVGFRYVFLAFLHPYPLAPSLPQLANHSVLSHVGLGFSFLQHRKSVDRYESKPFRHHVSPNALRFCVRIIHTETLVIRHPVSQHTVLPSAAQSPFSILFLSFSEITGRTEFNNRLLISFPPCPRTSATTSFNNVPSVCS